MNFYEQVYKVVRRIPPGKVTSYGHIARMLGAPNAARAVGYALRALKDRQDDPTYEGVPWHRVINSQGRISIVNREFGAEEQAARLRAEGWLWMMRIAWTWRGMPGGDWIGWRLMICCKNPPDTLKSARETNHPDSLP